MYTICECGHPASEHHAAGCEHRDYVISLGLHITCPCMVNVKTLAEQAELQLAKIDEDGKKLDAVLDEFSKQKK